MSNVNNRKGEHIHVVQTDSEIERHKNYFDDLQLSHRGLPELNLDEINTQTRFLEKTLNLPFLISPMTGGSQDYIIKINQKLAEVAEHCRVALGVGSQRVMLNQKDAVKSFQLRQFAPTIPLIANIGAVQLNYEVSIDDILYMIEVLDADALYLHFNPLQEAIQPEGNSNFSKLAEKVYHLNKKLPVPIIAKEVGTGFSKADILLLLNAGVCYIDVAGSGGTSWSLIESKRNSNTTNTLEDMGELFQDWGIPTPQAIQIATEFKSCFVIASGGVRNGIDMAKAIALGAQMTAMAAPIFHAVSKSTQTAIDRITQLQKQLRLTMFLLGCQSINQLHSNNKVFL